MIKLEKSRKSKYVGEVVDLFCGVGALSHGLMLAGFDIRAGYDTDQRCSYAFKYNNNGEFFDRCVETLKPEEIKKHFSGKLPSVIAGCAPCQPFSTYKFRYDDDPRWDLVSTFAKLAVKATPDYITMENVPSLLKYKDGQVFEQFQKIIENGGYQLTWQIAKCEQFGVPQKRRRLVVLASKYSSPPLLKHVHVPAKTVRDAISDLPAISAGSSSKADSLHMSRSLSKKNLQRIRASEPGGTWLDWPVKLRAKCHRRTTGQTYTGVYARMVWDKPAPTLTTQCYGFGSGRFGHPEQDRAISLREAAILQSFPRTYRLLPPKENPTFTEIGRWIGNAVPIKLAAAIGDSLKSHIEEKFDDHSRIS